MSMPKPPGSVIAWLSLVGVIMAIGSGSYGYGVLNNRVDQLEAFEPLSVDRRLGKIEAQLAELLRYLEQRARYPENF